MNQREATDLIGAAVPRRPGVWADLGAGDGTFTTALASLLGAGSRIYAIDRDPDALTTLEKLAGSTPVDLVTVHADFARPFHLPGLSEPSLEGLLFANALHFVPDPGVVLARLTRWLGPGGRVVIVEYDRRAASRWVPYPITPSRLADLAAEAGLSRPRITATRPSAYGGELYVATADRVVS